MKRAFITLVILAALTVGATWWSVRRSSGHLLSEGHATAPNGVAAVPGASQEQTLASLAAACLAAPDDPAQKRLLIQAIYQIKGPAENVKENDAIIAALISVLMVNKYIEDDQGPRGPRVLGVSQLPPWSDLVPAVGALERIGVSAGPQLIRDALKQDRENANVKRGLEEEVISKILPQSEINRLIDQATADGTPSEKDQGAWFKVTMGYYFKSAKQ